jgi:hypothetical protein
LYVSPAYAGLFDLRLGCLCIYFHLSVAFIRFMIANNYSCSGIAFLYEHMRTIDRGSFSKNRVMYITYSNRMLSFVVLVRKGLN